MRTAAALVIGNELLSGKVADENVVVLARLMRKLGIDLRRVVMIQDGIDLIADEVKALSSTHDFLFTSGGVGPTHDDVTVDAVAKAFGREVVTSPKLEAMLRSHYGERLKPGHLFMARIPVGCDLATTEDVPWPTIVVENTWLLPGVPEIFRLKLTVIEARLAQGTPFVSLAVHTSLDEGTIKPHLDTVVAAYPDLFVGSYPKWNDPRYRTKLTFDGLDAARVQAARDAFAALLPPESLVLVD